MTFTATTVDGRHREPTFEAHCLPDIDAEWNIQTRVVLVVGPLRQAECKLCPCIDRRASKQKLRRE